MHRQLSQRQTPAGEKTVSLPFTNIGVLKSNTSNIPPEENPLYGPGLQAVSYLYNKSTKKYGENQAVYNQKDRNPDIYSIGVLDIEKSQLPDILPRPWQTDTCTGNWFYDTALRRTSM